MLFKNTGHVFGFENDKLNDFGEQNGFASFIKCSDDDDPVIPLQRPRGKGDVAVLWREDFDKCVAVLEGEGSDRIYVMQTETSKGIVMLINCYLPCRGLKQSETDFTNTTDEVREIVLKYKQSSEIVLVGNLNASLHRESPYARDKYLKDFMLETNFTLLTDYPDTYTYIHGKGQSVIEYIIPYIVE